MADTSPSSSSTFVFSASALSSSSSPANTDTATAQISSGDRQSPPGFIYLYVFAGLISCTVVAAMIYYTGKRLWARLREHRRGPLDAESAEEKGCVSVMHEMGRQDSAGDVLRTPSSQVPLVPAEKPPGDDGEIREVAR